MLRLKFCIYGGSIYFSFIKFLFKIKYVRQIYYGIHNQITHKSNQAEQLYTLIETNKNLG